MVATGRARLRDIATAVGVSVNTVSRALAGKDNVSEHTRALVQAEAKRLGYVPNTHARSLVLGSTMSIGLVITNPSNPYYAQLISGIEMRLRDEGYTLLLLVSDESVENEQRASELLLQAAVDGAIVVPVQSASDHWTRLQAAGVPLVFANRDDPELGCDFVGIDNDRGAYESTRHVIDQGARHVRMLEEDLPITPIAERISGFRRAMTEAGLSVKDGDVISVPTRRFESAVLPWQPEEAYRVARELISATDRPDAVVVGNDYFALGLYQALHEQNLKVPNDMIVAGYGDHPYAPFMQPPLTSVHLPAAELGATAVDILLRRQWSENGSDPEKKLVRPTLVVRESTRRTSSPTVF